MNSKRILHVLGLLILLAVVIPFVIYAVPGVVGANESYVILSGSMEPEMSPGDAVIVDDRGAGSIEEGDVITFSRQGSETVVTHRVVDVREENGERVFGTKGDANDQPDRQPVHADDVVGTVVLTIPFIGHVVHFVNTPLGFATTVILPIGLFVLSEVWTFARKSIGPDGAPEEPSPGTGTGAPGTAVGASGPDGRRPGVTDGGAPSVVTQPDPTTADSGFVPDDGAEREANEVVVDATDLAATSVLLVVATPYAAYVALQLQTLATIAIAYTVGFSAFALGALQIAAMVQKRKRGDGQGGVEAVRAEPGASHASTVDPDPDDTEPEHEDAEFERGRRDRAGAPETNGDGGTPDSDGAAVGPDEAAFDGSEEEDSVVGDAPDVEWGDLDLAVEEGESR